MDYMPFIWIGIAVFALIIEAVGTQLISVWFALGAFAAAVSCIFTDSAIIQFVVFIVVTAVSLILTRPVVKRFKLKQTEVKLNLDRAIGLETTLTRDITRDSDGEVKVLGDYWTAVSSDGEEIEEGARVKVLEIKGSKLVVERATAAVLDKTE